MGLTTPFPEPDSPELQRFAVPSPTEIVGLLNALRDRGVPLNVFFGVGPEFDALALLRIDEAGGLSVESPLDPGVRRRLLEAPAVTFVGFVDAIKLQFTVTGARAATLAGRPAIAFPLPERLLRLQRRGAARVRPESARGAVCRVPLGGSEGEDEALRVLDISTGGLAVLAYPERMELVVGMEIDGCRLDLPGVGGAVVSLRVRHVDPLPVDEKARCCGCEFVRMAPAVQAMLERYVARCEGPVRGTGGVDSVGAAEKP